MYCCSHVPPDISSSSVTTRVVDPSAEHIHLRSNLNALARNPGNKYPTLPLLTFDIYPAITCFNDNLYISTIHLLSKQSSRMSKSHSIEEIELQSLDGMTTPKRPITAAILSCLLIYFDIWFPSFVDKWTNNDYAWLFSANCGLALTICGIYMSWDFGEEGDDEKARVDSTRAIIAIILAFLIDTFGLWALTWDVRWNVGAWVCLVCVMVGLVVGVRAGNELTRQANAAAAAREMSENKKRGVQFWF